MSRYVYLRLCAISCFYLGGRGRGRETEGSGADESLPLRGPGEGGRQWLAITHKSHDHGRQGFNDRLAFLGKRILDLHASLSLLNGAPSAAGPAAPSPSHPALEGIDRITPLARSQVLAPARLAKLAHTYGLDQVVRWKPKKTQNLSGSGLDAVLAQAVYAIVGALALQRGGEVAVRCARERVLQPLGLR